nr:MAG TPA: protein of unknown function (DUF4006) [Caudoviricetes sp.]
MIPIDSKFGLKSGVTGFLILVFLTRAFPIIHYKE